MGGIDQTPETSITRRLKSFSFCTCLCLQVVKYWSEKGKSGFLVWRYLLRRDDPAPAPWTKEGKMHCQQLGLAMQVCACYLQRSATLGLMHDEQVKLNAGSP